MKLRFYSDIHNEFRRGREWVPAPHEDDADTVLVLAGDIDVGKQVPKYVDSLAARFNAVVYILGNHELYNGNIDRLDKFEAESENAYLLNNSVVEIDGVEFIGSTLWTDMRRGNSLLMARAPFVMNDFGKIRQGDGFSRFTANRWIQENNKARSFLESVISEDKEQVVITHHAPDTMCSRGNPMAGEESDAYYYNSGLENLIMKSRLWIYGHTHHKNDQDLGGCRVMANPRGYDHEDFKGTLLTPNFDESGVIEL